MTQTLRRSKEIRFPVYVGTRSFLEKIIDILHQKRSAVIYEIDSISDVKSQEAFRRYLMLFQEALCFLSNIVRIDEILGKWNIALLS